jgi:hypothetical protein
MSPPLTTPRFNRFVAIDWSGAKGARHPGIAMAHCGAGEDAPKLIDPPPGRHWSRAGIRDWVLAQRDNVLIGFDFSFAPPWLDQGTYLPGDQTPDTARSFWDYVEAHCDDEDLGAASFLEQRHRRHFYFGSGDGTKSEYLRHRVCEARYRTLGGAKPSTIFDAIGAAQVAKASFAGMRLLHSVCDHIPVWPFQPVPVAGPVIVEIYTSIAARCAGLKKGRSKIRDPQTLDDALAVMKSYPHQRLSRYTDHATDAILTSAWLRNYGNDETLWSPVPLTPDIAQREGWTFGVT